MWYINLSAIILVVIAQFFRIPFHAIYQLLWVHRFHIATPEINQKTLVLSNDVIKLFLIRVFRTLLIKIEELSQPQENSLF